MSRYNPHHAHVERIYEAARQWRTNSLMGDSSVFSKDKDFWATPWLDELDIKYVQRLDVGEGDFLSKLEEQLKGCSAKSKQLMAECLWLLLLFPVTMNIGSAKKREIVCTVWSWSGEKLDSKHPLLDDEIFDGIGSAGTAYNASRWRELVFLINALREFKNDSTNRKSVVSDSWQFSEWLNNIQDAEKRQLPHILPHLLFPDDFERISSKGDKRRILAGIDNTPEKVTGKWNRTKIDHALLELRQRLEKQYEKVDFYEKPFKSQWRGAEWSRDEFILALDFYFKHHSSIPGRDSQEIKTLSSLLQKLCTKLGIEDKNDARNANYVHTHLMNFHYFNPNYDIGISGDSDLAKKVFKDFQNDIPNLENTSKAIQAHIKTIEKFPVDNNEEDEFQEGRLLTRIHKTRERANKLVKIKKEDAQKANNGDLICEACGFNFKAKYGDHGDGFIECHHKIPVSEIEPGQKTKLEDLSLLCANCHRMIHRRQPWLSVEGLIEIIRK